MFDKFIIYLTEKKLALESKKENLNDKLDDVSYSFFIFKDEMKKIYNKHLRNKVDKITTYFNNVGKDLDDATTPLYNLIWYRSDGRVLGYIMSVIISIVLLILFGVLNMAGLPQTILLLSLIPVSLIPIDIITTTIIYISNRLKRIYNKSLNRMKKEYGVINNKDLIKAYKEKHEKKEQKVESKETTKTKNETNKEERIHNKQQLTDSKFLEKMFIFLNYTKYIKEEDRKMFLDEINYILSKYTHLKNNNYGREVNGYLRSDVEHLQNEYNRYLNNQSQESKERKGYQMQLRKK